MALESKGFGASPDAHVLLAARDEPPGHAGSASVRGVAGSGAWRCGCWGTEGWKGSAGRERNRGRFAVKEIFTMWRHTQMVVLVALSAAIYAASLIATQGLADHPWLHEHPAWQRLPLRLRAAVRARGRVGRGHREPDQRLFRHPGPREHRRVHRQLLSRLPSLQDVGCLLPPRREHGAEHQLGQEARGLRRHSHPRLHHLRGLDRLVQ